MSTTRKLRLGPLPKSESIKLTITLSTDSKNMLDQYATLHSKTYGESVDSTTLIPHMLEAFMVRDREFRKHLADDKPVARPLIGPHPPA